MGQDRGENATGTGSTIWSISLGLSLRGSSGCAAAAGFVFVIVRQAVGDVGNTAGGRRLWRREWQRLLSSHVFRLLLPPPPPSGGAVSQSFAAGVPVRTVLQEDPAHDPLSRFSNVALQSLARI
jgi:hypothetical protein